MVKLDEMVRVTTPDGQTWLCRQRYFVESDYTDEYPGVAFDYAPEATGLELAGLIDSDLESANYHSLCGFAGDLHSIVKEAAGEEAANKVLEKMYVDGTLQNLY